MTSLSVAISEFKILISDFYCFISSAMAEAGEQRWLNTEVRVLPGDRDGSKHYVTGDDMIFVMDRERCNCYFYLP